MDKIKEYAMITVIALSFMLITGVAKSDEKTHTPQEVMESFAQVPAKVGSHIQTEWTDIKQYQAKSWAEAKAQWANNKAQLAGFFEKFVKTESTQ